MNNNSFEVHILVNGNKCKQYQHQEKIYVESKSGSEYSIQIKNNNYKRILAICSVDGLNVLTGKTASDADTGYVIDSYHEEKIKGFRYSDNEWAMFRFGYKMNGNTYAQSKQDGSEQNCGVIGVRLFEEKKLPVQQYLYNTHPISTTPHAPWHDYPMTRYTTTTDASGDVEYYDGAVVSDSCCNNAFFSNDTVKSYEAKGKSDSSKISKKSPDILRSKGFDMGTEWGRKEASKCTTVEFERGHLVHLATIYYASRESLIEMGVPMHKEIQTNLPQSFPGNYATPPKHWQG